MPLTREALITYCKERGWAKYHPDKPFTLASGKTSPYYFDMRSALLDGWFLANIEDMILELIEALDIPAELIGGMDVAARPFVSFVSYLFHMSGFVLRKGKKNHGLKNEVDGLAPKKGQCVLIVEDVVTTGGSAKKVADYVESCGAEPVGLLTLLDRSTKPLPWIPVTASLFIPGDFFKKLK